MNRTSRSFVKKFFRIKGYLKGIKRHDVEEAIDRFKDVARLICNVAIPFLTLISFGCLIYDVGYNDFYSPKVWFYQFWRWCYYMLSIVLFLRFTVAFEDIKGWRPRLFNFSMIVLAFFLQFAIGKILFLASSEAGGDFLVLKIVLYSGSAFLFVVETSTALRGIYRKSVNPSLLFTGSFFLMIMAGAFLLMLPNATTKQISPIDAWFTSASAICVTGLTVVDTATAFTTFGKLIILLLIQAGGLGIMTFAGLLAYISMGSVSISNQLALKDMLSSNRMGNVIGLVRNVIIVTLSFELAGALLLYATLDDNFPGSASDRFFFSIFHSVSAFCNAGFSTMTNNLYESPIRFNYPFQLVIAMLIVLGGIGFPIVFNVFTSIRKRAMNGIYIILNIPNKKRHEHIINTSSRLALFTTVILLVIGFIAYLVFEIDGSLKQHPTTTGKIVTSLFGSVTPRTAGFNTVDLSALTLPTVMIYLLLMWIGASPGSTGGGIKTTVAAVAFLNMKTVILRKDRTEAFHTQVSEGSVNRAFAIILLSLLVLGATVLLISMNDSDKGLLKIAFEAFSAFSTVGLTLGITPDLSAFSKLVLSIVMLIGRVGTLTLLFAFITPAKEMYYRYPTEEVLL